MNPVSPETPSTFVFSITVPCQIEVPSIKALEAVISPSDLTLNAALPDSLKEDALTKIEGIEEDTANELIQRANEFYQKDQEEIASRIKKLGLENQLINLKGLTPGMLVTLGEQKILTLIDFADLSSDELTGTYDVVKGERVKIKGYLEEFALSKNEADDLIMSARNLIYKD